MTTERAVGQKLDNLQALRGVACLMVVAFHLGQWEETGYGLRTSPVRDAQWFGFAGVDLFFVLSGFIIAHTNRKNLGRPAAAPGYLFRRLWRVYPPLWAVTVLAALSWAYVLNLTVLTPGWETEFAHWLTLLPGARPNAYVSPAWTLAYEVMFYLAFVGLILLPGRVGWLLLAGWGVAVLAAIPGGRFAYDAYNAHPLNPFVLEFLAGCAVAWLIGRGVRGWGRAAVVAGCVYMAAGIVAARQPNPAAWMEAVAYLPVRVLVFGPAAALVVYGLAASELAGTYLSPRWLRPVGDASYSIYLTHAAVGWHAVMYGALMPHSKAWHMVWLGGTFTGCVAFGFLFHHAVERPLLGLAGRRTARGPAVIPAAPPVAAPLRRAG